MRICEHTSSQVKASYFRSRSNNELQVAAFFFTERIFRKNHMHHIVDNYELHKSELTAHDYFSRIMYKHDTHVKPVKLTRK